MGRLSHTLQGFYICFYTSQLLCRTVNLPQHACYTQCFEGRSWLSLLFSHRRHGQLHICSSHSIATFPPMTISTSQLHDSPHAVTAAGCQVTPSVQTFGSFPLANRTSLSYHFGFTGTVGVLVFFALLSKESWRLAKYECEKR